MGWAAADEKLVPELKSECATVRSHLYICKNKTSALRLKLSSIAHAEKRVPMLASIIDAESNLEKAYQALYDIDTHLNR